jgi:hypothetical protein
MWHLKNKEERSGDDGDDQMARREWGKTCRNKEVPLCAEKRILEYKLISTVGFIGDAQLLTGDHIIELLLEPFVLEYSPLEAFPWPVAGTNGCALR